MNFNWVLGKHRQEDLDLVIAGEGGEEGDGGIDHALGLGDDDRAAPEAGQPVPLAGVVALDPVRLVLADIELADGEQFGVGLPAVGAIQPRPPALQALQQPLQGSSIATAAFPVNQPPRSTIPSLPNPQLAGFFLR
jgi:hypothetical protein